MEQAPPPEQQSSSRPAHQAEGNLSLGKKRKPQVVPPQLKVNTGQLANNLDLLTQQLTVERAQTIFNGHFTLTGKPAPTILTRCKQHVPAHTVEDQSVSSKHGSFIFSASHFEHCAIPAMVAQAICLLPCLRTLFVVEKNKLSSLARFLCCCSRLRCATIRGRGQHKRHFFMNTLFTCSLRRLHCLQEVHSPACDLSKVVKRNKDIASTFGDGQPDQHADPTGCGMRSGLGRLHMAISRDQGEMLCGFAVHRQDPPHPSEYSDDTF